MIKTSFPHINPQVAVSVKSLERVWRQQKVQGDGTAAKKTPGHEMFIPVHEYVDKNRSWSDYHAELDWLSLAIDLTVRLRVN